MQPWLQLVEPLFRHFFTALTAERGMKMIAQCLRQTVWMTASKHGSSGIERRCRSHSEADHRGDFRLTDQQYASELARKYAAGGKSENQADGRHLSSIRGREFDEQANEDDMTSWPPGELDYLTNSSTWDTEPVTRCGLT